MRKHITKLPYIYRDAANYKEHAFIYLDGCLTKEQIASIEQKLEGGDGFIPFDLQLGVVELQDSMISFPSDDDHVFHEFNFSEIEFVGELPEGESAIKLSDFLTAFDKLRDENDWDVAAAEMRLGIGEHLEAETE